MRDCHYRRKLAGFGTNPVLKSDQAQVKNFGQPGKRRRGARCLIWAVVALFCLVLALIVIISSAYAGWNAGVETARSNATESAGEERQEQCDLLSQDLAGGKLNLAQSRIEWLERATPIPSCLQILAPTATAAFLLAQPSATPIPTQTATRVLPSTAIATSAPPTPIATAPVEPQITEVGSDDKWEYDIDALLAEAKGDLEQRNYVAAIDTLEAIVSIDASYQRDLVRSMLLDALTARALALYRSFKLSEAIVMTERAEVYGDIGELAFERYVADIFLLGQRYKTTNPAEAVRRFSEIFYQHNPNYMNGQVVGELQDALRYYADALLLQGDACLAQEQYAAALALPPSYSPVSRGVLTAKQREAAQSCGALGLDTAGQVNITPAGTALPIGVRDGNGTGQSN